jgi:tetratricopeptide (TPR) repeat protein
MNPSSTLLLAATLVVGGCSAGPTPLPRPGTPTGPLAQAPPSAQIVERARGLHGSGERESSDRAVSLLEEHVRHAPGDGPALYALGDIHLDRGVRYRLGPPAFMAAEEVAHRLIPMDPARGHELLGRSYMWRGEHSFALTAFEQGIERVPGDAEIRAHLAWRHFQTGEHHRGIPTALAAIRLDSTSSLAQEVYGFSLFHIDRPDLADDAFHISIAVDEASEGYGGLHLLALSRGDDAAAIAYADWLLEERPDWPASYAFAGHIHYFAGNDREAIRYLEEAVRRSPDVGVQYTGRSATTPLAYLYLKQGRGDEAGPLLEHALSRADRRMYFGFEPWNSYYQFAGLSLMRGNRAEALRWLQTALVGGMPGPVLIERDPIFTALRGDPQFEEIVGRLRARRDEIWRRLGLT